jgi:hypothetical protein
MERFVHNANIEHYRRLPEGAHRPNSEKFGRPYEAVRVARMDCAPLPAPKFFAPMWEISWTSSFTERTWPCSRNVSLNRIMTRSGKVLLKLLADEEAK